MVTVMQKIAGQKDPIMLRLRDLLTEDGRRRSGWFFAEGEELVRRAFDYGGTVDSIILTERYAASPEAQALLDRAASVGAKAFHATEGLLSKMLEAKPTPECLAIVERRVVTLGEALAGEGPLVQMVEFGENADNLGMLLRSTDAAGVSAVIISADTTDPFARRVVRGSRGAVFTVPICIHRDPAQAIEQAKAAGLQVIATSARTDVPYASIDYTQPTMIVVGNEHTGISDVVRAAADAVVRIPMHGRINSLNIAVAASVVLYEAVRQRGPDPPSSLLWGIVLRGNSPACLARIVH